MCVNMSDLVRFVLIFYLTNILAVSITGYKINFSLSFSWNFSWYSKHSKLGISDVGDWDEK